MGIYDREYYREQGGFSLRAPRTAVGQLILVNVAIWLADAFLFDGHQISSWLGLRSDVFAKPWLWWEFLSYGFAHSQAPAHIMFNMFMLWMFGSDVEPTYGSREFLRVYLAMIITGGLVWVVSAQVAGDRGLLVGASAGVVGVAILFVLNNPNRTILFMFVLPMPAWLLGVIMVGLNVMGAVNPQAGDNVAYVAHLAGAGFAFLYFRNRWNLGRLFDPGGWLAAVRRRRLRVHVPPDDAPRDRQPDDEPDSSGHDLGQQVDEILQKIHDQGEASLTRKERRVLEAASREYQRRRQNGK